MDSAFFVIEDHPPLLMALQGILEIAGYDVLTAVGGAEALEVMAEVQPDLVMSDIMIPQMDGYAIYETIRARPEWASIPFTFLTARTDKEHRLRAKELGINRLITKPFKVANLLATIHDQLEQAGRVDNQESTELDVTILRPTEVDMDRLLEYICTGARKAPPALDSIRLCGQPAKWDLSLLRNDQLAALEAAATY